MATESWPSDLPQEQFLGIEDKRKRGTIRTNMDKGPKKVRKRFSAAVRRVNLEIYLEGSERADFDDFFKNDLDEGAKKFDWEDPVDDETVEFRFIEYPSLKLVRGGSKEEDRLWKGKLKLEILPS